MDPDSMIFDPKARVQDPDLLNRYGQLSYRFKQVVTLWGYLKRFGSCIKIIDFRTRIFKIKKKNSPQSLKPILGVHKIGVKLIN